MKLRTPKRERPTRPRATEVMATPESAPVLFSAEDALLPRLNALRADRLNLRESEKIVLPLAMATLSLLLPNHTAVEQADLRQQEVTLKLLNWSNDFMVLLLIYKLPELPKTLLDKLRQTFSRETLKKKLVDSLNPLFRPSTSTVLMSRLLYPDAPDLDSEDGLRDRLVASIIGLQKYNPSMQGDAAELVLIHPELKGEFQAYFLDCLDKYNQGKLYDHITRSTPLSSDIIMNAFYLEVLYGDTFEGLDRQGKMKYKQKSLGSTTALPERDLA